MMMIFRPIIILSSESDACLWLMVFVNQIDHDDDIFRCCLDDCYSSIDEETSLHEAMFPYQSLTTLEHMAVCNCVYAIRIICNQCNQ